MDVGDGTTPEKLGRYEEFIVSAVTEPRVQAMEHRPARWAALFRGGLRPRFFVVPPLAQAGRDAVLGGRREGPWGDRRVAHVAPGGCDAPPLRQGERGGDSKGLHGAGEGREPERGEPRLERRRGVRPYQRQRRDAAR